jgi:PST family polysaccharide transporter
MLIGCWGLCRWRPSRPERRAQLDGILRFGIAVTGCNIATALTRSVDQILIGWLWGPAALGLYERSVRLLLMPINNISVPLYAVAMPALSRIGDARARYRAAFGEILSIVTMMTAPLGALVAMSADWLVLVIFGPAWQPAVPLVSLFGIAIAYQPAMATVGLIYLTKNRPRALLRASFLDAGLALALVLAGLPFGVVGVAAAVALGGLTLRLPLSFYLASRTDAVTLGDLYAATAPAATAALLAAVTDGALRHAADPGSLSPFGHLVISGLGAAAVALAAFAVHPRSRDILLRLARSPRALLAAKPVVRI